MGKRRYEEYIIITAQQGVSASSGSYVLE